VIEIYANGRLVHKTTDIYRLLAWTRGVIHAKDRTVTSVLPKGAEAVPKVTTTRRFTA